MLVIPKVRSKKSRMPLLAGWSAETEQGVDRIARSCGFGEAEHMRTTFQRHLSIAPRDYRRRVSTNSTNGKV